MHNLCFPVLNVHFYDDILKGYIRTHTILSSLYGKHSLSLRKGATEDVCTCAKVW